MSPAALPFRSVVMRHASLALALLAWLFSASTFGAAREVRVGVYDNPPKLMLGKSGRPDGIFGDLLVEIARQEGWTIEVVACKWDDCLDGLSTGRIDLLPDVARTEEREGVLDFHAEPALHSWSVLFVPARDRVASMLDFKGKRIAVLAGSVQESYLRQMFAGFGVEVSLVPVTSFDEGFALVAKGGADAAAANHYYGEQNARRYGLMSSSAVFLPSRLFFATLRGANADLLAAIDRHLANWQASEVSPYYKVLNKWMAQLPATVWPAWLGWAVVGGVTVILVVVLINAMLRRQVRVQTARLEADFERLREADESLGRQHDIFRSLIKAIPDLVWLKDQHGVYLACNPRFEAFFGARENEIVGKTDHDFVDHALAESFRAHDRAAVAAGKPTTNEEWLTFSEGGYRGLFETTKTPMHDSQGRLIGVLGIAHEITGRKQVEQALRDSEERLNEAQALAHLGSWSLDLKTGEAVWSDEEYRLLGYPPGGVPANMESFLKAVHPEDAEAVRAEMRRASNPQEGGPYRIVHRVLEGERIVEQLAKVSFDADGRPVSMFGTTTDITERKRIEKQIEHLAYHDPLTGLPNRALFLDRLALALAASLRTRHFGAVMFVDLDQFKRINDVHGHSVGDRILKDVAQRLRGLLRQEDTVARFGGDEFVILLAQLGGDPESSAGLALAVAEKVRTALEQPLFVDDQAHVATASIGVTLFPKQGENVDDLIREADIAMYRAKDSGRNALMFFEYAMQVRIAERYALERDLRDAVRRGELELYLQSQVDVAGEVIGAEALLRWRHPTRGLVSPATFIPLAEESSLIVAVGEWVLRESCKALARLNAAGGRQRIAVNVSPRQFRQADFLALVRGILAETGADPHCLTLEITENLLVEQTDDLVSRMLALSALGVRFAIDDFGTGYSSLAYLKGLPLNELKIDRSFVEDVPGDPNDVALVETILAMARHLNYEVVAEGVETPAQREFLVAAGCQYYQGYLFHRPVPAGDWLAGARLAC